MAALRTQIYLTQEQRKRLDARALHENRSLAELIREAVDSYLLADDKPELRTVLAETFGSCPNLVVPSRDEWSEREKRLDV